MTEHNHCVEIIRAHAANRGNRPAMIFSADEGTETLTYAQLDQEARRTAVLLRQRVAPGDRALLLSPSGIRFATNFLGCLYAGVIATTAPMPDGYQRRRQRLAGIATDAKASVVLTDSSQRDQVCSWLAEESLSQLDVMTPDVEANGLESHWSAPEVDAGSAAFLQYTSGSVSTPKGVVVEHGNIVHNTRWFLRAAGVDQPDVRIGGWLPMFHDFGLIGMFLAPLVLGGCSVLMAPSAFLRRPISWFELIDRHDVVTSGGPNFAYELCTRRITDAQLSTVDLSRWRTAINGSEPVLPRTMHAFSARFAAAGFRPEAMCPGYGMAEATLCVSIAPNDRRRKTTRVDTNRLSRNEFVPVTGESGRELAACGPATDFDVRIVEPHTREVLPAGRIGEIWVRGRSVTRGYWNRIAATGEVFDAITSCGEHGYLRTGDLGTIHDGELYITGRIKDLLIVHGRKLYPQDLEAEIRQTHPALADGSGAVFTAADDEIVVVHECAIRTLDAGDPALITMAIRDAVAREFGVAVAAVVLTRPGTVARTTSGKIQRSLMRQRYLDGEIPSVHADPAGSPR
jgi:acyl-CoA synthetase (AMP-forming)/AMP-acid ligase II